ncbi:MAG: putative ATP-dependent RNA helicase ddx56 [Marteilia pararefringens]
MIPYFPSKKRMILTTATFNDSINQMKPLLLRKPTTVKLKESEYELNENLMHYKIECQNDEKYTILFSLFKLHLLTDKTLIFVNSVNQSYKVKIFLAQFGINSCVLNPELPLNSRLLAIKNFNSGRFNLLISSDFTIQEMEKFTGMEQKEIDNADYAIDKEFNLSRGIDFVNVKNVLNFDCPTSVTAYIHRAGRTTRMNKQGVVLTLLPRDGTNKKEQQSLFEEIYQLTDKNVKQFAFKLDEVEALKYRCSDIMNKITKQAVKSYRIQEIKTQLLDSKKLKDYFAQHPTDQFLLQKSIKRQMIPKQAHLDFLPEYLVPNLMKKTNINSFTSSSDNAVRKMNGKTVLKATKEKSKDSSNFFNIGVMSNKERKTRKKNKTKKGKKQGQRKAKKVIKVKKSQML